MALAGSSARKTVSYLFMWTATPVNVAIAANIAMSVDFYILWDCGYTYVCFKLLSN